jgi:Dyp-type peroxidase family
MTTFSDQDLHDIQGFGVAGFRKDHEEAIFVRFGDAVGGRRLLRLLQRRASSAWEVGTFNALFSEVRSRTGEEVLKATWVAVMLSASSYAQLGVPLTGLPAGEGTDAFAAGMAARKDRINDTRPQDAPEGWEAPFRPGSGGVHLAIVIGSDTWQDLDEEILRIRETVEQCHAKVVFAERGARLGGKGNAHEHFGFRDGGSQPAIEGYDLEPAEFEPPTVPAGEFVLGYPDALGNNAVTDPLWIRGSFVAFRRLAQDVLGFRRQTEAEVPGADPPLDPATMAAKMMGRWPSGAPLELNPDADPGQSHESNAFQYAADPFDDVDGQKCPRWAHIRKANPRDEATPTGEDNPALHRMIRRGIPYGEALPTTATDDTRQRERGLHFFAVVGDVARQFEFVQRQWLDDPNFPTGTPSESGGGYGPPPQGEPDGPDPVVGHHDAGDTCSLHQPGGHHPFQLLDEVVTATAGEYFFLPSLTALASLAQPS